MKRLIVQKVQAKRMYGTVSEVIIHLKMMKDTIAERVHQRVENTNITQTNIHLTVNEAIPYLMMRKEMQKEHWSIERPQEIHLKTDHSVSQIRNHQKTVTVIIGGSIRRLVGLHTKRQNLKSISNRGATPRIIDDIIHRMKMISTIRRRRKRVNVHGPDQGIVDDCFVVLYFARNCKKLEK